MFDTTCFIVQTLMEDMQAIQGDTHNDEIQEVVDFDSPSLVDIFKDCDPIGKMPYVFASIFPATLVAVFSLNFLESCVKGRPHTTTFGVLCFSAAFSTFTTVGFTAASVGAFSTFQYGMNVAKSELSDINKDDENKAQA